MRPGAGRGNAPRPARHDPNAALVAVPMQLGKAAYVPGQLGNLGNCLGNA